MPTAKRTSAKSTTTRKSKPAAAAPARRSTPKRAASSRPRKSSSGPTVRRKWTRISNERKLDILGIFLVLVGLLTLLSMVSSQNSPATGMVVLFTRQIAGSGSIILPVVLMIAGIWLALRNVEHMPTLSFERIVGAVLLYTNVLTWIHLASGGGWDLAQAGGGGGMIGAFFERILVGALGTIGAGIALGAWSLVALAFTLDISISEIFNFLQKTLASGYNRVNRTLTAEHQARMASRQQAALPEPDPRAISELPPDFQPLVQPPAGTANAPALPSSHLAGAVPPSAAPGRPRPARQASAPYPDGGAARRQGDPAVTAVIKKSATLPPWKLPTFVEILEPASPAVIKSNQDAERGKLIEETLASFGTPVKIVNISPGPTVTEFGVEPLYVETRSGRTRVRVSKIVALADDLALALAAPRIRIQAPVPGRNYVGIEVPNLEISRVTMREVLDSDSFRKIKSPLRFALGKDVSGHAKAYDLAAMPHLLIAGTTGSGKSVCVNALLCSLLLHNTPTDLKMILVDPKRVELTGYNGIPHLLSPVIVEAEQVVGALQWVQREMDARYHRFSQVGARNIADYNARNDPPLPYMLVLVDELADLMMLAPDETERSLTRLAQLARATGIHLVLATQRPSVDVITGLIKANFPARVAFAVASGTDSRVILDQPGAERLLGRGDMLFQAPDAAAPIRLQGAYVFDQEIQRLVEYWRQQAYEMRNVNVHVPTATPVNMDMPVNAPLKQDSLFGDSGGSGDPVLPEAIKIVRAEGKASISMLQRKMRIGYTRAARLVDQLEEQGIIGPAQATSQVREVLDFGDENDAQTDTPIQP